MSHWKKFGLAIFAAGCLLNETTDPAHAQCTTCAIEFSGGGGTNLGSLPASEYLPASMYSIALSINNTGQAVGYSTLNIGSGGPFATEWNGGRIINLGLGAAYGINNAGQAVGYSPIEDPHATEWSGGNATNLGGLPGFITSAAYGINAAGQAVGYSYVGVVDGFVFDYATEWSGGSVINLGNLPGSTIGQALSINNAGQAVGFSGETPLSGVTAKSSTWGDCQARRIARPSVSTIPGRQWDGAESAGTRSPLSGATAASSTWEPWRAPATA
jgi:probable HAF family extracellular repeat protein